jgi:hypothetical protein
MPVGALTGQGHEGLARSDAPSGRALDLARGAAEESATDDGGQLVGAEADRGVRDRLPGRSATAATASRRRSSPRATRVRVSCGGMPNVSMMSSATRRKSS